MPLSWWLRGDSWAWIQQRRFSGDCTGWCRRKRNVHTWVLLKLAIRSSKPQPPIHSGNSEARNKKIVNQEWQNRFPLDTLEKSSDRQSVRSVNVVVTLPVTWTVDWGWTSPKSTENGVYPGRHLLRHNRSLKAYMSFSHSIHQPPIEVAVENRIYIKCNSKEVCDTPQTIHL